MARTATALIALLLLVGCSSAVRSATAPTPEASETHAPEASETHAPQAPVATAPSVRPGPATVVELPQPTTGSVPVQVELSPLGAIDIVPVGLAEDGQVEIPENISKVGWYRFGPTPSEGHGSIVLVGHRDSKGGRGALFDLAEVPIGARLAVLDEAASTVAFVVVSNASINKGVVPFDVLFARTGPSRLVIISCGGEYVRGSGYQDNQVLVANLAGA